MTDQAAAGVAGTLTNLPLAAQNYLAHTVLGQSIRSIAREQSCHPSTILRQVRRFEFRRDDPLVDAALKSLTPSKTDTIKSSTESEMTLKTKAAPREGAMVDSFTQIRIDREAMNVLRRLCETRAVLAVARDMETAVVVREDDAGGSIRTAVVEREIAQALALKGWISCKEPEARIARYAITGAGRDALRRLTAQEENRAQGFGNDGRDKRDSDASWELRQDMGGGSRYMVTESPLVGLARRRDKDGERFLSRDQVDAGERIRQDYEIANVDFSEPEDWAQAIVAETKDLPKAAADARKRLASALDELGPGLADIVIRCCCRLDGLEITEKHMGWSARSGKIVLRIALTRLLRHYEETHGKFAPMIG